MERDTPKSGTVYKIERQIIFREFEIFRNSVKFNFTKFLPPTPLIFFRSDRFFSPKNHLDHQTHIHSLTFREKKVLCNCALSLCYALFQTLIALKRVLFAIEFFPV